MQSLWAPFQTSDILYTLVLSDNLTTVLNEGLIPREMLISFGERVRAVVLTYAADPTHTHSHNQNILQLKRDGYDVLRLHIRTDKMLYRSLHPERSFQVLSFESLQPSEIVKIERMW